MRVIVLLAAIGLLFVVPATLDFVADWLWFGEVGYRRVYSTEITARGIAGALTFALAFAWCGRW